MGGATHQALLLQVSNAYEQAQRSGKALKKAMRESAKLEKEMAALREAVEELEPLGLQKGEEEELEQRYKQAAHSQDLYDAAYAVAGILYDAQESVHEMLTDALQRLKTVAQYDEQMKAYTKELESALIVVDDTARELERYREQVDFDPQNLEKMNQRLSLLSKLRKKYQMDSDLLVDTLAQWQDKINGFDNADAEMARLKKKYQEDRRIYVGLADQLHESREPWGKSLCERLVAELADMDMKEVQFRVDLDRFSGDATGTDIATFMISPNRGMPIRPLYDIASGGEMSRIMLAIKTILSGKGGHRNFNLR